ncbi:MAG: hypothetical protein OEV94_11830 [Deltaproteobacteria bacterium]|nr:hypothetical protein [Deltaproteobacteria bacterium]
MAALTTARNTPERAGNDLSLPVAANAKIYQGALVAVNATGFAVPGSTATTLKAVGRANAQADNTGGADGAVSAKVSRGVFKFSNSGADPIGQANVGGTAYIVDDQTVAATNGAGTRSAAGKIIDIESDGVWVEIR